MTQNEAILAILKDKGIASAFTDARGSNAFDILEKHVMAGLDEIEEAEEAEEAVYHDDDDDDDDDDDQTYFFTHRANR